MANTASDQDEDVQEAQEEYERCYDGFNENYNEALEDFRFGRLHQHWPENIVKQRNQEQRPCLTIPKLPPLIRQVVNDARQNKPAISVHPVDSGSDPDTATALNGLIRCIEQSSDAEVAYDTALDHAVTGGFGWFRVNTRYTSDDGFEQDVVIEAINNCFSVLPDPDVQEADSANWNIAFEIETVRRSEFELRYPDAEPVSFESRIDDRRPLGEDEDIQIAYRWKREPSIRKIVALSAPNPSAPPDAVAMGNNLMGEKMIMELDVYEKNKPLFDAIGVQVIGQPRAVRSHKVRQCIFSGAEELGSVDWPGKYIPIIPVYGEDVNVEGKRYLSGLVRPSKDSQRMFNYWRSTSTELVALAPKAPFIGKVGQFVTDADKWANANTQSYAYIEYDGVGDVGPPQRQPFAGVPAGALQEALNAADDIKSITGLYDASLGARSNETSGRAIMARQREGDVGTYHYIDNLSRSIRHCGRVVLDLIPHTYSTLRVVRILGPDGKQRAIEVAPTDVAKRVMAQRQQGNPNAPPPPPPEAQEGKDQAEEVMKIYSFDAAKYDVTVAAGPSFTSRREEAASQMIELIRAYPQAAPLIGDLLARNLDWPGADEIAERMKIMLPPQLQGKSPEAIAAQQKIEEMSKVLEQLHGTLVEMQNDRKAENRKLEIEAFNAETNRLKAVQPKGVPVDPAESAEMASRSLMMIINSPDILEGIQSGRDPGELAAVLAHRLQKPAPAEPSAQPEGLPDAA
jgi:hypothetical protein